MRRIAIRIVLTATLLGLVACDGQVAPPGEPGSIQLHMNGQVGVTIGARR